MFKKKVTEPPTDDDIIEKFSNYLKAQGKRRTPERYEILNHALAFPKQFTVDDLKRSMEKGNFRVSQATLYYTVDLLVEADILRRMSTGTNAVAYERVDNVRYIHLLCQECGKVKLVKDTNFMAYMNARRFAAFTTSYYNLTVYGTCNDCARRIKRLKRELNSKNKK
jgi:Fur family ferric uptake transcriptional regulator